MLRCDSQMPRFEGCGTPALVHARLPSTSNSEEGCGSVLEVHDHEAWLARLQRLAQHPAVALRRVLLEAQQRGPWAVAQLVQQPVELVRREAPSMCA